MRPALDENALTWAQRCLWAICIAIYLTAFAGGILAGGDDLFTMGRAAGLTLAAAVLGKVAIGLLAGARLPDQQGPTADQLGPVGSLVDAAPSTNVAQQEQAADAA